MKSWLCKPVFHLAHNSSCVCPSWIFCVQQMQMSLFKWLAPETSSKREAKQNMRCSRLIISILQTQKTMTVTRSGSCNRYTTHHRVFFERTPTHTHGTEHNKCFLFVKGRCEVFLVLCHHWHPLPWMSVHWGTTLSVQCEKAGPVFSHCLLFKVCLPFHVFNQFVFFFLSHLSAVHYQD